MPLALEDFCDTHMPTAPEPEPAQTYEDGYAAGLAAAQASAEEQNTQKLDEILQILSDLSISYEEARQAVIASLKPFFTMLSQILLPEMARAGLTQTLLAQLNDAASEDSAIQIRLMLPPSVAEDFQRLTPAHNAEIIIAADPDLLPGQAILRAGRDETIFDANAACAEIRSIIAAITDTDEGKLRHG